MNDDQVDALRHVVLGQHELFIVLKEIDDVIEVVLERKSNHYVQTRVLGHIGHGHDLHMAQRPHHVDSFVQFGSGHVQSVHQDEVKDVGGASSGVELSVSVQQLDQFKMATTSTVSADQWKT